MFNPKVKLPEMFFFFLIFLELLSPDNEIKLKHEKYEFNRQLK